MAIRIDPSPGEAQSRGRRDPGTRSQDLLEVVIDALSEGLAIFDAEAALLRTNTLFRDMNPTIAGFLETGVAWDLLLREWVARGGVSPAVRDRLDWMEARLADGERSEGPLEAETNGRVTEITMHATATGGFVLVQRDITEQRSYQETERQADMLLRRVLEACPANIVMSRVGDGEIIYRTPAATELLGMTRAAHAHFASREERADFITALLPDGRVDEMAVTGLRADGSRFPGLISARLIDYKGEDVMVSSTVDVSKEVELRRKLAAQREQIFQSEKLAALGELLAGVAHELNNPLSVVVGHALMLRDDDPSPEALRRVEKISAAAERCARIVKSFLAMARQQPAKLVPMDLVETLEMAIDALRNGADGLETAVEVDVAQGLPLVRGDAHQIAQVILNLVTNADQAIRDSGVGDSIRLSLRHDVPAGMVDLRVTDNGPGIPAAIRGRVFDPLFTTKPAGSGTGLGLALCHRVVAAHSGQIRLEPDRGRGATFLVRLPVTSPQDAAADRRVPGRAGGAARGRVLVVDDEADVSELICEILRKAGFETLSAGSAEEALDRLDGEAFALILTDLNMPGLGGRGLYEKLLRERPALARRVGFVTGDTMSPQARGFLEGAGRPYLEKPIAPAELRRLVQAMLGASEGRVIP